MMAVGGGFCTGARIRTCRLAAGSAAGGADGVDRSVPVLGFVQHFFHERKLSKAISANILNIVAREENIQCLD